MHSKVHRLVWRAQYLAVVLAGLVACKSGSAPGENGAKGEVGRAAPAQPAAAPPQVAVAAAHTTTPSPAKSEVEWPATIEWHSWQEALVKARAESKPIMVVVYADWCPKCRALAPVLDDPEIVALSKKMVLVHQNHDDSAPWLEEINQKFGGYVPRIFFFDSTGKMKENVTSDNPRYPYFYAAQEIDLLRRSMRRAAGT